ncbi:MULTISPECIES: NAD(P)/FAD-dependent oxidoreductase [Rhodococcus]|uniref:NAD(P)/FAD-dependent oxidoreductase n=1 Tax=Rhodococcus oxybenzonivorans TaxID=1990687 RepID=A0AAE4UYS8_9NOCA|nr:MULTISPECIES: NAD(P)/FAD-dependent oxidoreductase [Rhodococcus]MDV7243451.1 NAD(P)/FAD-dependent oxidoreductase [Rhodococcus oxybenzonivorans]MDV7265157.1 NAD(P)/FAD-dependent oxidoreductase [Rhodococcus oxybenzonivorans]MDV7277427.1 NAD(P)/FAD-dependent oxidoreductase [Rhodococcus oxybenzonivorans]MDV7335545.1 NAD(P)/FAD-dependent oxidoreductase [Rhodococcus oxybenzonivorans]MDV7347139.1 NAD(P)/FAD-dependent oxidoreductase [Rhodococcus oxybenzonivorans]
MVGVLPKPELTDRETTMVTAQTTASPDHHVLAIVGSGFAGIGAAVRLSKLHEGSVVIFERAATLGGVWRDNDYPGAACDVQSLLYSFSFAPSHRWRHTFARQAEIREYLERVARENGLLPRLRAECAVTSMTWDPSTARWTLETARGTSTADHVVLATGSLADPTLPAVDGIESFEGVMFHSSQWDHETDLSGRRVAVVGTGASAIQFVPKIQPIVGSLTVFQRTAPWVMPREDKPISSTRRALLRTIPGYQRALRALIYAEREIKLLAFRHPFLMAIGEKEGRAQLHHAVRDPELRDKLTPNYRMGCKRILLSDEYYPALAQPNVNVETVGVSRVTPRGVVDANGTAHEVDAIIFGTGFETSRLPLTDRVFDGRGRSMADGWGDSPRAYLGTMVANFPNLYLMHGPNIALGHTSVILMFESQIHYIERVMAHALRTGGSVEPTVTAQAQYADKIDDLTDGTVWTSGGCSSWYLDPAGRNSNLWPGSILGYRSRAMRFDRSRHTTRIRAVAR